ncbi:hypothetical protein E3N88_16157 [Mikania micrantha]|uniref:N-acetyltransferase domain-containing protein n=1 Tax=Mikania micrantha TaxID=192012 RepID=A0A5N6NYW4_9ASTR|nr:hypothetical protein E3N88_16157 [Mikania micrantha]
MILQETEGVKKKKKHSCRGALEASKHGRVQHAGKSTFIHRKAQSSSYRYDMDQSGTKMVAGRTVSISLDGLRDKNLMQLKKLNSVLFPVRYNDNDKYYADALASDEFTKLGIVLHQIRRLSRQAHTLRTFDNIGQDVGPELWVHLHLLTCSQECFLDMCVPWGIPAAYYSDIYVGSIACRLEKKEGGDVRVYIMTLGVLAPYRGLGIGTKLLNHVLDLSSRENIGEIYLHVQTNNEVAINFYKKFGFEITETIQYYHMNITPPDCYVVTKYIGQLHSKK